MATISDLAFEKILQAEVDLQAYIQGGEYKIEKQMQLEEAVEAAINEFTRLTAEPRLKIQGVNRLPITLAL